MMKKIQYVPLRKGQMDKYLEMAKRENVYPIIYIGLQCGLRQSELISLPWAAVDFSERVIRASAALWYHQCVRRPASPIKLENNRILIYYIIRIIVVAKKEARSCSTE